MNLTVQLPDDVAAALVADGQGSYGDGGSEVRGGLADIAAYAAVFAGDSAALVTLLSTPDVLASVAGRLGRRRRGDHVRWLNARGPGGEVTLRMTDSIDEKVLAALLAALWTDDSRPK